MFNFIRHRQLSLKVVVPFWIPTSSCYSVSLPEIVKFLNFSYSNRCVMISFCFKFSFPNDKWCWTLFMWLCAICISLLMKYLFRSLTHFQSGLFVFLLLSCKTSCILNLSALQMYTLQIFSPTQWFIFYFL